MMDPRRALLIVFVLVPLLALGTWFVIRDGQSDMNVAERDVPDAESRERPVLYWYDPMYPDRRFDAPGPSPFMDMELVPKYADGADGKGLVHIDPRMVQNLGVRTEPVERGTLRQRIDTTARIEPNERSVREITVRASGWIEALHVRAEGDPVRRGELLAEVYSPALDVAQRELLLALEANSPTLIEGARAQLRALGMAPDEIERIEERRAVGDRIRVVSPMDGYVMRLNTREGAAVAPEEPLFEIVSHDPVWVVAQIPEAQASWVREGHPAEVRVRAHPGRVFEGRVDYLYPDVDRTTRTRRARLVIPNPDDALHPGMYADVTLFGDTMRDVVLAPTEAVIRTGTRNVVIVEEAVGRYRPVEVRLGAERAGSTVILAGLEPGQRVVTSGQFLIDSEASLIGAYQRLTGASGEPAPPAQTSSEETGHVHADEGGHDADAHREHPP